MRPATSAESLLPVGLMVLVVDDDSATANLWQEILWTTPGVYAVTAADGQEAIQLARELRPDVILMDLNMPGIDGLAATRRLKADPRTEGIPIIAVTGASYSLQRILESGCDGYMFKPLSQGQLMEGIRRVLR